MKKCRGTWERGVFPAAAFLCEVSNHWLPIVIGGGVDNSLIRLVFDRTRFRRVISGGGLFSCFLLGGEIVKNDECRSLAIGYLF